MSTAAREFARYGQTRVLWSIDPAWPLVKVEAVDPAAAPGGLHDYVHWNTTPTGHAARSYAGRAYGARFDSPARLTLLDEAEWGKAVAEARRLHAERIATRPSLPFSYRVVAKSPLHECFAIALEPGLLLHTARRVAVVGWGVIDFLDAQEEGFAFTLLSKLVPGREVCMTRETFYEFIHKWRPRK